MRSLSLLVSFATVFTACSGVTAQEYPNRPVRIITSSPGGGNDFSARIVAQGISPGLGQPVIVDYRGVVTNMTATVMNSQADGYTLLLNGSSIWILPLVQKVPYDMERDFAPISQLTREINVLVIHPSLPVKSVKDLIALAKEKPGMLNYAGTGLAAPTQLAAELFKSMAGVNIVGVAYKSNDQAIITLLSGDVHVMFPGAIVAAPHVKNGKVKALAVTSASPSVLVPGLPTIAASGLPGYELVGSTGVWAPAKTPSAAITRLNQEIVRLLNTAEVKERYLNAGIEVVANSPEQFRSIIRSDISSMGKVIKEAGIRID